ncbi:family 20 glycosylhydrolase [Ravibacter arvi]|uniref:beta-N-acetylhexosaminidase n=1 Tax=Ravibacter arvi TaxID=2051041 RepID=A0ABP8MCK1_9BACT
MQKYLRILFLLAVAPFLSPALARDSTSVVRGFCIAAPTPAEFKRFTRFVEEELVTRKVNTLILRVDFNYQYKRHPELVDTQALSESQIRQLVKLCKAGGINLIPQINLLGHQSWAGQLGKLLAVYPQFDETPHVKMPEKYAWPNPDGLYCKSYCPLHPDVHGVVFELVDELMEVFETKDFHAGLDEVFYIGDDKCPRCGGRDKAELFAGEVTKISNHLRTKGRTLWLWGDRLLDGKQTGLGMWEASMNNTHRAVDLIPKDVVVCDWHYERAEATATYLAMKGLPVITCPWDKPQVAQAQFEQMVSFRKNSNSALAGRYLGMMQTIWTGAGSFMDAFYKPETANDRLKGQVECFKKLFESLNTLN